MTFNPLSLPSRNDREKKLLFCNFVCKYLNMKALQFNFWRMPLCGWTEKKIIRQIELCFVSKMFNSRVPSFIKTPTTLVELIIKKAKIAHFLELEIHNTHEGLQQKNLLCWLTVFSYFQLDQLSKSVQKNHEGVQIQL